MKKQKNHDNEPVTRGEFREAIEELQSHVDDGRAEARTEFKSLRVEVRQLSKRVSGLEVKVDSLERMVGSILKIVQSIDGQMKEQRDMPERVARLERAVFRLQTERK